MKMKDRGSKSTRIRFHLPPHNQALRHGPGLHSLALPHVRLGFGHVPRREGEQVAAVCAADRRRSLEPLLDAGVELVGAQLEGFLVEASAVAVKPPS